MTGHPEAMRGKRRALALLVGSLALVAFCLYRGRPGAWGIAAGWAALLGGLYAAARIMACPACGERMASLFEKVCRSCGAVLTDEPIVPPEMKGPIDREAAAYLAESRRILERWSRVRRRLGQAVPWSGVAAGAALAAALRLKGSGWGESLGIGAFVGAAVAAAAWLMLVHGVDQLWAIGFLLLRGRCPVCRAWLNPPASASVGSFSLESSLPEFCGSCGAKLG